MSNFQRGGRQGGGGRGFHSPRDQQGLLQNQNSGVNRMNDYNEFNDFNRGMPQNRVNPWDISSGMGGMNSNGMGGNLGNNNMGNNNMGGNMGSNRPSGGLLPTPNIPAMTGLLQPPSMQDVQLAVANKVLNLLLPSIQNQQTNQLPSLLGPSPNCNGLLPLSPPVLNPFNTQNFRGQGSHQDTMGSNRNIRPNISSRRSEPYNKTGNRNQRPGQKSDERKTSNVSPRRAVRGPGLSPKNVVQHARNSMEEKGDSRKNQKTENSNKDVIDDKDKRLTEKQEHEKIRAEFADIPCGMLTCHVCSKNLGDCVSFVNHVKGKAHLSMIDRQEEQYKSHTEKLRHQMKVEEQQRQISLGQNNRQGRPSHPTEYCTMCNLNFNGNLAQHRKGSKHQQLKSFLHPRCNMCDKEFPTRIDYDHHLLTSGHLKIATSKTKKDLHNEDAKNGSKQPENEVSQEKNQKTEAFSRPDAVLKKASNNCNSLKTPLKTIVKTEVRKMETGLSKVSESEKEKFPAFDSQKEIGMDMLQEKTGYLCRCCNRFLSTSSDAKTHCRSLFHYEKYIAYQNSQPILVEKSPKPNGNEKSPCNKVKAKAEKRLSESMSKVDHKMDMTMPEVDSKTDVTKPEENNKMDLTKPEESKMDEIKPGEDKMDETKPEDDDKSDTVKAKEDVKQDVTELEEEDEDEEDEGNWKRRKISKDEDLSMDTTVLVNKEESTKKEKNQETEPAVQKDAEDEQLNDGEEDAAISSDVNEDLEKTLLLEDIPREREESRDNENK